MKIQIKMPPEIQGTGFPTFEEFAKNPDRWRPKKDELFGAVDHGGNTLRHLFKEMTFEILGHQCVTLEEVERIAINEGYTIDHLDAKPQLREDVGGSGSQKKCRVHVVFEPKLIYLPE